MKKIILLITCLVYGFNTLVAQEQPSQEAMIKYNLFKGDYKSKNYEAAYENWIWCLDSVPTLSVNIYKLGINIAKDRFKKASKENKEAEIALVRRVYDQRIELFPKDLAKVYSDYADFLILAKQPEQEVFEMLKKAYKIDPSKMGVKSIFRYFRYVTDEYKEKDVQYIFDTYDVIVKAVDKKLNYYATKLDRYSTKIEQGNVLSSKEKSLKKAYENNSRAVGQVVHGLDKIINDLSTCERLIPLYTSDFESNKENGPWLKSAVNMMYKKKCTEDPLYDKLVEAYVAAEPSPEASVFYAGILVKNNNMNKATEYFLKAVDQESDPFKKANYEYKIAQILRKKGLKSKARAAALQAIKYKRSMGEAYLLIANLYASSANKCGSSEFEKRMVYVAAQEMAQKAANVDPVNRSRALKYVKSYKASAPDKKAIFTEGLASGSTYKIGCWIGVTVKIP
jgi:tetratricopeptide (TPR) repeat protein